MMNYLKTYNEIWVKVKNNIKKKFDSEPLYNEKYLKAKIKSYNRKINTNLHNNKRRFSFICWSVILILITISITRSFHIFMLW